MAPDDTNTAIYGGAVEGEVSIKTGALPTTFAPPRSVTDQMAEAYVRQTLDAFFGEGGGDDITANGNGDTGPGALAYAPEPTNSLRDLGVVDDGGLGGVAENVTVMPKRTPADQAGLGRTERILTVKEPTNLEDMSTRRRVRPASSRAAMVLSKLAGSELPAIAAISLSCSASACL